MRRDPDFFADPELDLIYMARTLRDALRLESVLEQAGVDYLVETGNYTAGFLMKRELKGAFFYVAPRDAPGVRQLLLYHRYEPYGKADGVTDGSVLKDGEMHS